MYSYYNRYYAQNPYYDMTNSYDNTPQNSPCNPMDDYALLKAIEEYIHDEMGDNRYYTLLAEKAPNKRSKDLLLSFGRDEENHAMEFMKVYYMLTGNVYQPQAVKDPVIPEYTEALKARILAESGDYKKYAEKYLMACNQYLKQVFFMARTDEAQHAMRMPLLLDDASMGIVDARNNNSSNNRRRNFTSLRH